MCLRFPGYEAGARKTFGACICANACRIDRGEACAVTKQTIKTVIVMFDVSSCYQSLKVEAVIESMIALYGEFGAASCQPTASRTGY